jgi:hypothetical protein
MHELGCAKLKDAVHHICRGTRVLPARVRSRSDRHSSQHTVLFARQTGVHVPIDIAKLTFGDSTTCYAFNSLHWGMASKVAVTAEKLRYTPPSSPTPTILAAPRRFFPSSLRFPFLFSVRFVLVRSLLFENCPHGSSRPRGESMTRRGPKLTSRLSMSVN